MSLSDEKELLLMKGVENGGQFTMETARRIYSTKASAKSGVQKLEALGFVERTGIGVFKVKTIPDSVEQMLKDKQDRQEQANEESEGRKFTIEPVEP